MKRFGLALLGLLVLGWTAGAQTSREELLSHMELTTLGARQHKAIARRMYDNYPSLMTKPLFVEANSSTSRRVMLSMANFCLELKALNPTLDISMDASEHDMHYITADKRIVVPESRTDDALYRKLKEFNQRLLSGEKQLAALFKDPERAKTFIDQYTFADDLYNVASDDVLVKFLLNENETSIPVKTDCAPYYHWKDVKRFWEGHPATTR